MKKGDSIVVLKDCPRLDYNDNTQIVAQRGDVGEYIGFFNGTEHYCLVGRRCLTLRESEFQVYFTNPKKFGEPIDPVIEEVVNDLRTRSKKGVLEYGAFLDRADYSFVDWLKELYEETLDSAGYIKAAINKFEKDKRKQLLKEIIKADEKDGLYDNENRGSEGFPKVRENVD